jgi:hypothetical protein
MLASSVTPFCHPSLSSQNGLEMVSTTVHSDATFGRVARKNTYPINEATTMAKKDIARPTQAIFCGVAFGFVG